MPVNDLRPIPLDTVTADDARTHPAGLWDGYLTPGDVTLLTSFWKTGKTTLLAGLLRHLGTGQPFLGRAVRPAAVWVVSEESPDHWAERVRQAPFGPHVHLLARPFRGRPTPDDWLALIAAAAAARAAARLDLFVIDPLASFLPGRCESDSASLIDALSPLHRLTTAGCAVLLLHHPRKQAAEAGSAARGSGALLGLVDVAIELTRFSRLKSDAHRRLLFAQGRRAGVPARLAYEWDAATGTFTAVTDPRERQFTENWEVVVKVLGERTGSLTHAEIFRHWPDETSRPGETTLYEWLNRAAAKHLIRRVGKGTKLSPWRYSLPTAPTANDLPPLPDLPPLGDWHD